MRRTEEVYGNQSFSRLRDANCFEVYLIHITMLENHKDWLMNNPETYDIYTKIGYIDHYRIMQVDKDIAFFKALIKQAKDNL